MANESCGEVDITIAGKTHTMRPTFQMMRMIESRTGKPIGEMLSDLKVKDTLAVIEICTDADAEFLKKMNAGELDIKAVIKFLFFFVWYKRRR